MIYKIRVLGVSELNDYSFYLETRGRKKIFKEDIKKFMAMHPDEYPYNLNHETLFFYPVKPVKIVDKQQTKE